MAVRDGRDSPDVRGAGLLGDSMSDKPTKRGLSFTKTFPWVSVGQYNEQRSDHAMVAVLMAGACLLSISEGSQFSAVFAFLFGYAFSNWVSFPELYGSDSDD